MKQLVLALVVFSGTVDSGFRANTAAGTQPVDGSQGIVNIREHGAVGDGSTDDMPSIVATFASVCASGGGTIYIPAGVFIIDPASAAIPICSSLVVYGPGTLRVKPNAGNYRYIFAPNPVNAMVNGLTFNGITVDQNAANNSTATIRVEDGGALQMIWQIYAGTGLHFENMNLYVSGVNPIDVNGVAISGVYIERNYIVFQKRPGQPAFDNSSIYIDGDNFHVNDNTFVSTIDDGAVTAIEVHSGSGSVTGNTIDGYEFGMNIVNVHDASAIGNHVVNAAYGISLWSTRSMNSVIVSGNTVSLAQVTRRTPSAYGIATSYNNGVNGEFSNMQITGNVVTFEQESGPREIAGAVNYGIGLQALGDIGNVLVMGNQIIRAPVRGITVGVSDARYATARVLVRDNQIVDAGSNFSLSAFYYSAAIAVQGNLSSVEVTRNRVDFLSHPFIGHFSYWSSETGFTFQNVLVADNSVTAADGSPTNGLTSSVIQVYPPQ
jgi:Pectate lyase superfamily protein